MGTTGLEPGTSSVSWKRSNQLSYAPVAARTLPGVTGLTHLPLIDVKPLIDGEPERFGTGRQIDQACRELGFFRIVGHGIDPELFRHIDVSARAFFAQPDAEKALIAMPLAGPAWRGWFPVGDEVTSGVPDRKEGIYFGLEHPPEHPRVIAGTPLHGMNQFPAGDLRRNVLDWLDAVVPVAAAVMSGIAIGLGLPEDSFATSLTADPTVLFRIFHYPALAEAESDVWSVGEHTDYGLVTLLAQDACGGLEVQTPDGDWIEVPAEPDAIVCNLGDMLDRLTDGRYRSTPHRVRNSSGRSRLSFPLFFDPSWDAHVAPLPLDGCPTADDAARRWDGESVRLWVGPYGDYLLSRVAKVFPDLFATVTRPDPTGAEH